MNTKLMTEHRLEFLCLTGAVQARLSLQLSKCRIVGNLMSLLIWPELFRLEYIEIVLNFEVLLETFQLEITCNR